MTKANKSQLSHKLIAAWLKYDPFVSLVAKDNSKLRHDAMLALAGEKAAKKFFGTQNRINPPPELVYPGDVRKKEQEFLDNPDKRSRIIRQLVFWGRNEYINTENPDSHSTRTQIISSLLGPMFLNSNPKQEKLIIEGLKVLVISRPTNLGIRGEQSPMVHQEIITRINETLKYNQIVIESKQNQKTEAAIKAHLIKTIQSFKQSSQRSAYYVADDQKIRKKIIAQKFPLNQNSFEGLVDIVKHYTTNAWAKPRKIAINLIKELELEEL